MIDSHHEEIFEEANRSTGRTLLAAAAAFLITALVFAGYAVLRKRHAQTAATLVAENAEKPPEPPKALVVVDEALLQGGNSLLAGTVKNTSTEKLEGLSVELELRRRKDGGVQTQLIALEPSQLEPQQEGRYSLQLKAQDYSSARLVGLRTGPSLVALPYTTAQGQKRPPERLESKTIIVGKPASSKRSEFLNSPDKPARVP